MAFIGKYRRAAICLDCGSDVSIQAALCQIPQPGGQPGTQTVVCTVRCERGHVRTISWPVGQAPPRDQLPYRDLVIKE
jgi:hypothetical protein